MKTLRILLLILFALPAFAQDPDPEENQPLDPKVEQRINAARVAYITERLGLTPEEAEKFWPIYREYAQKRKDLRHQFREARKKGIDESKMLELDLKIKQEELDLEKDYSGRLQKIITPQKLMHLRQAEGDFRRLLLKHVQQRRQAQENRQQLKDRSQQRFRERNN